MHETTVLLAQAERLLADALAVLLGRVFHIVETVYDGRTLVQEAIRLRPAIIVSEVFLPLLNGIDAARHLKGKLEHTKFLFLTKQANPRLAAQAFRIGALGFISQDCAGDEFTRAVEQVASGRAYLTPLIAKETIDVLLNTTHGRWSVEPQLTVRQREVLQLIAEGRTTKQVAETLRISPRTAETHKYETMEILGVHTTAELTQWAIRLGLLPLK